MTKGMVWLGGLALLAATIIDTLAVIGRSVGLAQHGSIELIQTAVLVAGALALVAATLAQNHARVHLVIDRLPKHVKAIAIRVSALLMALFFAGLFAGSFWISLDLWSSHEVSELIGVPWRWLRAFANVSLAAAVVILVRQGLRGRN
jgi:TRAP-type C4-dicarboxylate transport system permease small subunit